MNNERYLDPPEENEPEICEDCNIEMTIKHTGYGRNQDTDIYCTNQFCPGKFKKDSIEFRMAEYICTLQDRLDTLKRKHG